MQQSGQLWIISKFKICVFIYYIHLDSNTIICNLYFGEYTLKCLMINLI